MNQPHFLGLQPGMTLDRYVVEGELGRGGVATVYLVRHSTLDTAHALKVVHDTTPVISARLMEEGRLQARLRHPNVVSVTDVLVVNGHPALLAEFVSGGSLRARMRAGPIELKEAERIFRGIVAGVAHAHDEGMAHRDLKPENVLLDHVGGTIVPRVSDFGIARSLVDQTGRLRLTRTGEVSGTPSYMAPEQARSLREADHRVDIFALGAMLYEMTCGTMAFPPAGMLVTFRATAAGDYVSPRTLRPELADRFVRAIDGCLRPNRDQRPQSCEALLAILDGRDVGPRSRLVILRDTWNPEVLHEQDDQGPAFGSQPPAEAPDASAVAVVALFTDAAGTGHAADLLVRRASARGAVGPEESTAEVRSAADIAVVVGMRGIAGIDGVRWQVRGSEVRLAGESLGLALALATRSLATGIRIPGHWAVTGCLDLDGRVRQVAAIPAKLRAAAAAGMTDVVVPDGTSSTPLPAGLRVHRVRSFEEAVNVVFGPQLAGAEVPPAPNSRGRLPALVWTAGAAVVAAALLAGALLVAATALWSAL